MLTWMEAMSNIMQNWYATGAKRQQKYGCKRRQTLFKTYAKKVRQLYWNPLKSIQIPSKIHQNSWKFQPWNETWKKQDFCLKKWGLGFFVLEPKVIQNGIRKSWKSRHRKSIQKWCPKDRKGMTIPKIMKISYKNRCRKMMEKTLEKHWKIKPSDLEIHCFSLGKTHILQNWRVLEIVEKVFEKVIQNDVQISLKTIKNFIRNRHAEKHWKIIEILQKILQVAK